ncbi:MAG TPA: class I SAM-dependent methyltransferase family protein [Nitrososphaerales archaeon]|nr:class I SAM-dependent methyltransferase family protein [Nitrososphaerales archaeon]|tara:strand:+ start:2567 stop:3409 length:843 start_codon:yes stop_codon:yes gene_type:complete
MARMLKKALTGIFNETEIQLLYGGFDVVGNIAVIKIPDSLMNKKRIIATTLLDKIKPVTTVLMQSTPVSGDFRTRHLELIGGEDKTTTEYREHGCIFKVDLATAYFSPRLSTERQRIAELVQPGETVVNLFAGVGAFSIIIAKKVPETRIYSVDINPEANQQAIENIRVNKVNKNVIPILGDARNAVSQIEEKAERVLMPLPEKAAEYLDTAIELLKTPYGVVHYYTHTYASRRENAFEGPTKEIKKNILKNRYSIVSKRIVREVGPRWYQVVLDLKIST